MFKRSGKDKELKTTYVNMFLIGVGNGAVNIVNAIAKKYKGIPVEQHGNFFYVTDTNSRKTLKTVGTNSENVKILKLIEDSNEAFGTGGAIDRGEFYAQQQIEQYKSLAETIKKNHGVALMIGCLGGGSTGALPVIASTLKANGVKVEAFVTVPAPERRSTVRTRNTLSILEQLKEAGINVVKVENKIPKGFVGNTKVFHNYMDTNSILPMLKVLMTIFRLPASEVDADREDNSRVNNSGWLKFLGYLMPKKGEEIQKFTAESVFEAIRKHTLQDERILEHSKACILCFEGDWDIVLIDAVQQMVTDIMAPPEELKPGEVIWIKVRSNLDLENEEASPWVALLASGDIPENAESEGPPDSGLRNLETTSIPEPVTAVAVPAVVASVSVAQAPAAFNGSEKKCKHEIWLYNPSFFSKSETSCQLRPVSMPISLKEQWNKLQHPEIYGGKLLPEEVKALITATQAYVDADASLKGCIVVENPVKQSPVSWGKNQPVARA